jgi:hypothetical protein
MNERIRELHNQARDFYLQDEYVNLSMKDLHRLVEEKFAQLIIRECADIATMKQHEWHSAGSYILEHFGVVR